MLTLIADLSTRFVNLPSGDVDRAIEASLQPIGEAFGADLISLWEWSASPPFVLSLAHVYHSDHGPESPASPSADQLPWWRDEARSGRTVSFSTLDELPGEASVDRETCLNLGVKSSLTFPLSVGDDRPLGMLAFCTLQMEREWPDSIVDGLRLVAQIIANALARKRHDETLSDSAERLTLAADAADAGLWTLDYTSGTFWVTERARAIFGFPPDEAPGMDQFVASIHSEDRSLACATLEHAARFGDAFGIEYRIILPGERRARWLAMRGRRHPKAPDESCHLMGAVIDVSASRRVEAALRKSEARLTVGADLAGLAFYELNFDTGTSFVDERFRDICGIPEEVDEGLSPVKYWLERLHPEDRPSVMAQRERLHAGLMERFVVAYRYLHPTRGEKWLHNVARVTRRDALGRTISSFGVVRDITERRRREEALHESYAEITRLKDRLQAESDYLKAEIGVIRPGTVVTGDSPAIQAVLRLVQRVAPTDSSVLIHGETGTGKELIAQAVHRQSPRQGRLMVSLNCAALPSGLVESELFGREKGAFTGALTRQIGRFELADHSTLFLDEIGELSPEVQAKLLRVLESGEFERLGNPRTSRADVRIIAATNRDLAEDVRTGRFRADLYYRLNVFPIRVPPLRERAEDIPLLVWAFLDEFSSRMGKKITQVSRKTMDALQRHRWPGNVRELRNVIEHAAILATGDTLKVEVFGATTNVSSPAPKLIDSERQLILRALDDAGWRIKGPEGAASVLGLNPSTLYSRMKKLGLRGRRTSENASLQ